MGQASSTITLEQIQKSNEFAEKHGIQEGDLLRMWVEKDNLEPDFMEVYRRPDNGCMMMRDSEMRFISFGMYQIDQEEIKWSKESNDPEELEIKLQ